MSASNRRPYNHITKTDMEASRLVFVFVKDAKPKRKVAVPVPDGYTWAEFTQQVMAKLKIAGIKDIFLAASGQKITSLDELQDIDELMVVEGQPAQYSVDAGHPSTSADAGGGLQGINGQQVLPAAQLIAPDRHKVVVSTDAGVTSPRGSGGGKPDDDDSKKYRRTNPVKRLLQRLLPSLFAPSLPITNREASQGSQDLDKGTEITRLGGRRKRGRRGAIVSLQTLLLLLVIGICVFGWVFWVFKASPRV